jgi:hypothetical protein
MIAKNYVEIARDLLEKKVNVHGVLLDLYTLLVFTKGKDVTLKDVHDAWAIWKNNKMRDHRSLIPFDELTIEVQELDRSYADAIAETAIEIEEL